jgi:acetyl esterase/lipase
VLIVQGDDDPIVARSSTDRIARSLRASGAPVTYHRYPGRGHFDLIAAAHTGMAQWIDSRLAETPPASRRPS